jgi:6-phosphogluconolactonase
MRPECHLFGDQQALVEAAADRIASAAAEAITARDRFPFVLSGGSTPQPLYARLIQPPYRDGIPWSKTFFFWGDERCVPPDQTDSNYGQAWQALLEPLAIDASQIVRMRGELPPGEAARRYARELELLSNTGRPWPRFDLVLLGMGDDGHIASLFSGPISPEERKCPVVAVTASYAGRPADRVTLTPRVFNDAREVVFLVKGASKAAAVAAALNPTASPETWPARRIQPVNGRLVWLLDRPAASQLPT